MEQNKVELALQIAIDAHKGQVDKGGQPYILHPIRLMSRYTQEVYQICAVLHDVVEDSDGKYTIEYIRQCFGDEIADVISLLTHNPTDTYSGYVKKIKTNEIATAIKIADLKDNTDKSRLEQTKEYLRHNGKELILNRIIKKQLVYKNAISFLQGKLLDY